MSRFLVRIVDNVEHRPSFRVGHRRPTREPLGGPPQGGSPAQVRRLYMHGIAQVGL